MKQVVKMSTIDYLKLAPLFYDYLGTTSETVTLDVNFKRKSNKTSVSVVIGNIQDFFIYFKQSGKSKFVEEIRLFGSLFKEPVEFGKDRCPVERQGIFLRETVN